MVEDLLATNLAMPALFGRCKQKKQEGSPFHPTSAPSAAPHRQQGAMIDPLNAG